MKTATLTFHGAHNYGSMLQAYALQKTIQSMGHENQIIHFRTHRQIDMYAIFTRRKGMTYVLKNFAKLCYFPSYRRKHALFEEFISTNLNLTNCYSSLKELEEANFDFDCYIAGSDQIWNPIPADFDWAYYLPFVHGEKKIAYAPSFGPFLAMGDERILHRIKENLETFDCITVRDGGAVEKLRQMMGIEAEAVLDPTCLLTIEEWKQLLPSKRVYDGDYIFFYTLFADKEMIRMVKCVSRMLGLPVVVSNFSNQYDVINPFKKCYSSGPIEFLDLIYHAKFVVTSSFHGTVFSILFHKNFLSLRGDKDARIFSLLNDLGLVGRTICDVEELKKKDLSDIDFNRVEVLLEQLSQRSKIILREMIETGGENNGINL